MTIAGYPWGGPPYDSHSHRIWPIRQLYANSSLNLDYQIPEQIFAGDWRDDKRV